MEFVHVFGSKDSSSIRLAQTSHMTLLQLLQHKLTQLEHTILSHITQNLSYTVVSRSDTTNLLQLLQISENLFMKHG
jgi:hypothetical protein